MGSSVRPFPSSGARPLFLDAEWYADQLRAVGSFYQKNQLAFFFRGLKTFFKVFQRIDFHFSDATLQFYHHFCANSNFEFQMYPGKTIQAIGHYKNVELYQLGRSKEKANANAKVDVLEMQKTMDLS